MEATETAGKQLADSRKSELMVELPRPNNPETVTDSAETGNTVYNEKELGFPKDARDSSLSWVVLVCSCVLQFISVGLTLSAGILVAEFRDVFESQPAITSLIGGLLNGLTYGTAPLAASVSNAFSHRLASSIGCIVTSLSLVSCAFVGTLPMLLLLFGILPGVGLSLVYTPSLALVGLHFKRWRPLALGISNAVGNVGSMAFPSLLRYLIEQYSWREMFVIMGGIMMQSTVCALLLIPATHLSKSFIKKQDGKISRPKLSLKRVTNYQLLCNVSFLLHATNAIMYCLAIATVRILLPDYANESGMSKNEGAVILSLMSVGGFLGKMTLAIMTTLYPRVNRTAVYIIFCLVGAIPIAMFPVKEVFELFATMSFMVGLLYGVVWGLVPIVLADSYESRLFTSAYSYLVLCTGLGYGFGPLISGLLFGYSGGYKLPYIVCAASYFLSGAVMAFSVRLRKKENQVE